MRSIAASHIISPQRPDIPKSRLLNFFVPSLIILTVIVQLIAEKSCKRTLFRHVV